MKNLILVSLPKIETTFPSGALAILSSVAEKNDHQAQIFDYNLDLFEQLDSQDWQELDSWCMFSSPTISLDLEHKIKQVFLQGINSRINAGTEYVAISVFSYFCNRIAELILSWYRNHCTVPIIVGGQGISTDTSTNNKKIFGEHLIESKLADFVIFGEGELALEHILQGKFDYPGINKNNPRQIEDLTSLPLPTYRYFDMRRYSSPKLLITGSRGCVRKCTFCDIELTWPTFRYRSAQHMVDEIKQHFYEYQIADFEFTDSLINGSISNFNQFNELLYLEKQRNPDLESIRYQGQFICRPRSQQHPRCYELMHLAGCKQLIVGIESFSESVRNHMRKKFSNRDIDYHLEQCAYWNIPNIFLMIVGYPTETLEDHQHTLETLKRYQKYADMGIIFMIRWGLTMHLYEHTPVMDMIDDLGLSLENNAKFDSLYGWTSSINPGNDLRERLRRRLELHELCVELGYPMPRVYEELQGLRELSRNLSPAPKVKKIISIKAMSS